jgi:probable rRNA maturation factor
MAKISFSYQLAYDGPRQKARLRAFLAELAEREGYRVDELGYVFCTDAYVLEINRNYLSHDTYTDIVTFDLKDTKKSIKGEIYISLDRIRENARTYGQPVTRELHRVIFHGLLHLCGYKDKLKAQQYTMRQKEEFYLRRYFGE